MPIGNDMALAGFSTVGTFSRTQLYAGEMDNGVTTQEIVAAGAIFGSLDAQGHPLTYGVGALVGGKVVKYDKENGVAGSNVPYCILPHPLDTSATGYNADVPSPVFVGGAFNFDALDADGATYPVLKAAFARTNIVIQKLY